MDYYETIWMGLQWFSKMWQMIALARGVEQPSKKSSHFPIISILTHFHFHTFLLAWKVYKLKVIIVTMVFKEYCNSLCCFVNSKLLEFVNLCFGDFVIKMKT